MLHIHQRKNDTDKEQTEVKERTERDAVASVQSSGLTVAGENNCKLSIVPVQVKARKGDAAVLTYAFLDPGSTASFCTVSLMNKLKLQGRKTMVRCIVDLYWEKSESGSTETNYYPLNGVDSSYHSQ